MTFQILKQLSQHLVELSICKTRITVGANNEKATNNFEGPSWTNGLQHNGTPAIKH